MDSIPHLTPYGIIMRSTVNRSQMTEEILRKTTSSGPLHRAPLPRLDQRRNPDPGGCDSSRGSISGQSRRPIAADLKFVRITTPEGLLELRIRSRRVCLAASPRMPAGPPP